MTVHDLPAVNATLNGLSAVFLTIGYIKIKQKKIESHRNAMIAAFSTSVLFLISYLTYHALVHTVTHFEKPEWFRPIYLTILLTHTVLAVVIVPMVIISLRRGLRRQDELHRKISKWTWPLWMYVSVTGVVVYLILYQIYPQR
ncbi:MAG: DUF420 domain-containing protein [Limisphaerales bacterium]